MLTHWFGEDRATIRTRAAICDAVPDPPTLRDIFLRLREASPKGRRCRRSKTHRYPPDAGFSSRSSSSECLFSSSASSASSASCGAHAASLMRRDTARNQSDIAARDEAWLLGGKGHWALREPKQLAACAGAVASPPRARSPWRASNDKGSHQHPPSFLNGRFGQLLVVNVFPSQPQ